MRYLHETKYQQTDENYSAGAKQMRRGHMRHVRRNHVGGDRQRFGHNYRIQGQFSKSIC